MREGEPHEGDEDEVSAHAYGRQATADLQLAKGESSSRVERVRGAIVTAERPNEEGMAETKTSEIGPMPVLSALCDVAEISPSVVPPWPWSAASWRWSDS